MMLHMTSCVMSYTLAVSNNREFYGTLSKNYWEWGTQYSDLSDPSILNPLFWQKIHKKSILTINSPLCSSLSGIIIIFFFIIIIIPGYHIFISTPLLFLPLVNHSDVTGHVTGQESAPSPRPLLVHHLLCDLRCVWSCD